MLQIQTITRKLYRVFMYTLAISIMSAAVMLSVARILLPELKGYRQHIEQQLGKYLEHHVQIASMDARLIGLTPTLIFKDVHLLDEDGGKELISFKEARLGVAVLASIAQRTLVPSDFTIVDTVISIKQTEDERYIIQGMAINALEKGVAGERPVETELASWLFKRSNINLHDSTILWKQKGRDSKLRRFEHVNVSLHNRDDRHQLTVGIKLPGELGQDVELALDVYGDLLNPMQWKGVFYFSGKGVRFGSAGVLPPIKKIDIKSGIADYDIWGKVETGLVTELTGDLSLYGVELQKKGHRTPHQIDVIKGLFAWRGSTDDWTLNVDNFQYVINGNVRPMSSFGARWKNDKNTQASEIDVNLGYCRLEDVRELLLFTGELDKSFHKAVSKLQPAGNVNELRVYAAYKNKQLSDYQASANVDKISISPWQEIPGIRGVSGRLDFSTKQGVFDLRSSFFVLNAPELFRDELYVNQLEGLISWQRLYDSWQITSRDLSAINNDVKMVSDLTITTSAPRKPVHIDLQVALADMNATAIPRYLPVGIMKKPLINWLDHAFVGGSINKVGFVYHGKYQTPPFRHGAGVLQASIEAEDLTISYSPEWTELHEAKFNAVITDKSVQIKSATAKIYNSDARNIALDIRNFSYPVISMSGEVYGSLADSARFLVNSPVAPNARHFVSKTRLEGDVETRMKMRIPLNKQVAEKTPLSFAGKVVMPGNNVYMNDGVIDITNLQGEVAVSDKSLYADKLRATIMDGKARMKLTTSKPEGNFVIRIDAEGKNSGSGLYKRFTLPGMQRVKGDIAWKSTMTLAHMKNGVEIPAYLEMKSDLAGVTVDLPEPFKKSRETNRDFTFAMKFTGLNTTETITQYGDRVSTHLEMDNSYKPARILRGEIHLAAGKASLPEVAEFRVTGVLNNLSPDEWREVFDEHLAVYKKTNNDPVLFIPAVFDMGYMYVPLKDDDLPSSPEKQNKPVDPHILPVMRGKIKRFVVGDMDLGEFDFTSHKEPYGLFFDSFSLNSPLLTFQGNGQWKYRRGHHKTLMKANMKTHNLGAMLKTFGYKAIIEHGNTQSHFELEWDAPPHAYSFGGINGTMNVVVENGNITKVDPGAGRLLGLLSLSALPRRLFLDFRDMSKGMSFDEIKGSFKIRKGDAVTDDLMIKSPLADVKIVGRTGLHKQDFDQIVTVIPQASGSLPVLSWLIGGTQVGGIVLVFERLFGSDMDKSLSSQYRITGSWKEPLIERIDKEDGDKDETAISKPLDEAA